MILILLTVCQASGFVYFVKTLNNTITKQESASFQLIIQNTENYDDYFTISTRDVNWLVNVEPASGLVPANDEIEFIVELRPKPLVAEGRTYFIPLKVKSETTGFHYEEKEKFAVYVVSPDLAPGRYTPTVTPTIYIDKNIDPKEKVSVRINLRNRNSRDLDGLKVVVNGEIFSKEYTTHLLPLEDKTNEILFEVDPLAEPGTKTLTLNLFFEDKKIGESSAEYYVQGYTDLKKSESKSTFLFKTESKYTIYNNGNQPGTAEKIFEMGAIERLFTKFSPDVAKEKGDDGKTYYVITQELDPETQLDIVVVTNYRLVVLIILLIIIAILLYYVLRSPVVVIKSADPLGKTKEGVSEVKVSVYLKNRTRRPLNNIRIVDHIPRIAEIEKKARLGSMEPINIGKSRKGSVARWELDVLEPYEERIITYRINSKLKLIGGIRLPSAKARYETRRGKERVTYSNNVNLIQR